MQSRNANLDLTRACAILMVVIYHTIQMLPQKNSVLWQFVQAGRYGVDLFFVLSGFLIGGLYWNEQIQFGNVYKLRFILRRILRTAPPYFITLLLAYTGVFISRNEPFDFGYLFFFQNYYIRIPFFFISWSLCVEEHFYLFLPFFLYVLRIRAFKDRIVLILLLTSFFPLIFRVFTFVPSSNPPFGYYFTASHLRFEGLILGILASYIFINNNSTVKLMLRYKYAIYFSTLLLLFSTSLLPERIMYTAGYYLLAVLFSLSVLVASVDNPGKLARSHFVFIIAITSYSIYLTHAMVIHIVLKLSDKLSLLFFQWLIMFISILISGYVYYKIIEKSVLTVRGKIIPKRKSVSHPIYSMGDKVNSG